MILRTPPAKRSRPEVRTVDSPPLASERALVIYEDNLSPAALPDASHHSSDHMLCTYQCRQMVKADFIDALSNAEKQVRDYQSKLEELNKNFNKAEAERARFRDQFLYAEQELAAAKKREEVLQQQLLKEVNDSQERLKKQFRLNNELTVKLQNETNIRMKAESAAATAKEKATLLETKLNQVSESTERDKKRLQSNLTQLESDLKFSSSRNRADLERMECRAKNAEEESELLKEQLGNLKQQLEECLNQKSEAEKKLSSFTFQEVSSAGHDRLIKHLQEELRSCESQVQEAKKLKSSHENIELLKEKLLEEKSRRERAEADLCKLQNLPLRLNNLEKELSTWKQLMNDIPGVVRPEDIPNEFSILQKEVLNSTMKIGEVNLRLKQLEVALDAAQLSKQSAETKAALANDKAEVSKSEVKRMELMLSMVTEEREKLRNAISQLQTSKNIEVSKDSVADQVSLQELESSLTKKDSYIKELDANLCEQKELNARQHDEIKALNERLISETKRLKSLERESDRLRSEISLLESKLGHGDFSSANTKVLRMVNTLAVDSDAKQTIEALQTELQKTKEKLQTVEELKSQSGDTGKLVDSYISEKIVKLKEQIATLEKREERYKTVFADRISVFRRACCELFGYKIVMDEHQRPDGIPVTHFSLQSIYALSDDEKLEFEYESGSTKILVNDYTSQRDISQQVEIFIKKMNSIPAFTANLTIESFNKRTLS